MKPLDTKRYIAKPAEPNFECALAESKIFWSIRRPTVSLSKETFSLLGIVCSTFIFFEIISLLFRRHVFIVSRLFENLALLSNLFQVNEDILVLVPLSSSWEGGTVIGFKFFVGKCSEISAVVQKRTIEIHDELAECREEWPIRNFITRRHAYHGQDCKE